MKTFIALFRGINVGGKNRLPMKPLAALMEKNGCHGVKTYIQSGNAVFQSETLPENLGELIEAEFGFNPAILFLDSDEFKRAVDNCPYQSPEGKTIHYYFCKDLPSPDTEKIESIKTATEEYAVVGKVFYLHAPDGVGRSKLAAGIEKCVGVPTTARNLNTVNKLLEMIPD